MILRNLVSSLSLVTALAAFGCTSSSTSSNAVSALEISPDPITVTKGNTTQARVVATFPDGSKRDVSNDPGTEWKSSNTDVASVNGTGLVVGDSAGVTSITASYAGATGKVTTTVAP